MGICRRIRKWKLKKLLLKAFELMDLDMIKIAVRKFQDYDLHYQTNKLNISLQKIINGNPDLNERNVMRMLFDFHYLSKLFDEEEEKEEEDESMIDNKLQELDKKRKEIKIRKNQLKQQIFAKQKRMKRRKIGGMG